MIKQEEVIKVGEVTKTHGISGELSVTFLNDMFENADPEFMIFNLEGILVPFVIEEYRFRSHTAALVKLEDVDSEDTAKRFVKTDVYILADQVSEETETEHYSYSSFKGFTLYDVELGLIGEILNIDESTINTLLMVDYEGEEVLIPFDESLITALDMNNRQIEMRIPEGLLSL